MAKSNQRKKLSGKASQSARTPVGHVEMAKQVVVAALAEARKDGHDTNGIHIHLHFNEAAQPVVKTEVPRTRLQKALHVAGAPMRVVNRVISSRAGALLAFALVAGGSYVNSTDHAQAALDKGTHDAVNGTTTSVFAKVMEQRYGPVVGSIAENGAKVYTAFIDHRADARRAAAAATPAAPAPVRAPSAP